MWQFNIYYGYFTAFCDHAGLFCTVTQVEINSRDRHGLINSMIVFPLYKQTLWLVLCSKNTQGSYNV